MMALLCLLCAALAVWWLVPAAAAPPASPGLTASVASTDGADAGASDGRGQRFPVAMLVAGSVSAATLVAAVVLDGVMGLMLGAGALVVGWTVGGLLRQRHRSRLVRQRRAQIAQAAAGLAAQLRIGQVPSVALTSVAGDHPVLREGADVQGLGGDVARAWRHQAVRPGCEGLLDLSRAWQVAHRTGAPMSASLEHVAAALAAEQSLRAVVAGELSAPRATGKVMAALPGCGIGLGYLLGGEPITWLLAGPPGWGCLLAGTVLACLGVVWIEALARRVAE